MIENIDKVLDRGERLELLADRTANMQGTTMRFKRQARRFRNTVWWRNVKLTYVPFSLSYINMNKTLLLLSGID
jgi:Synaptobrevin